MEQLLRFVIFGGFNTLVTVVIYQLSLNYLSPSFAYAKAWLIGIVFVAIVYPTRVFGQSQLNYARAAMYALSYMAVFAVGLIVVSATVGLGVDRRMAIFFVIPVTVITNFVIGKFIFRTDL